MPDERRPSPDLYESDFFAWTELQAELVRSGRLAELDVENIAEELETLGRSEKHALESHLTNVLAHLLKWAHQPQRRSRSWEASILNGRIRAGRVARDNPSLRPKVPSYVAAAYGAAVRLAAVETGIKRDAFPAECPWTPEQVLDQDFMP